MHQFKLILNILLLVVVTEFSASGQKFWLTSYEFPYGPKTSITGISDNDGMQWQHIPITIDGRGVILNEINVGNSLGLNISPEDSVYLTVSGVSGSAAVQLNLNKSIDDVTNSNHWNCRNVNKSSFWWLDRLLNGIHFAKNGDWYSSVRGSGTFGGTYFSKDKGKTWNHHSQGLGLDMNGLRGKQFFYEKPNGKIFMVQYLDERIYWADTSVISAIKQPAPRPDNVLVYPNPILRNGHINLSLGTTGTGKAITLINTSGFILSRHYTIESQVSLKAPMFPGIYLLKIEESEKSKLLKLLVL
jgi:hypothetical protein